MQKAGRAKIPKAKGIMMGAHGLINWADDDKECYHLSLELIERAARFIASKDKGEGTFGGAKYPVSLDEEKRRATLVEVLPWLRGQISHKQAFHRHDSGRREDAALR